VSKELQSGECQDLKVALVEVVRVMLLVVEAGVILVGVVVARMQTILVVAVVVLIIMELINLIQQVIIQGMEK
jgi:hypothetical protein